MHPFFDPKPLSDDDILKKLNEVSSRLRYAQSFIGDQIMIDQLELLMESLQNERQERMNRQYFDSWNSQFPDVLESDPEFKKDRKVDERKKNPNTKPDSKFKPTGPMTFKKEYHPAVKKPGTPGNSGS